MVQVENNLLKSEVTYDWTPCQRFAESLHVKDVGKAISFV